MASPKQQPIFITKPLLNSIPDNLLPRFDPTYVQYYNKYNAGRLHTHQIPIETFRANPSAYTIAYGRAIGPNVFRITEQLCPVADGSIKIRIFEPAEVDATAAKRPVYINFHGGGWVFGGLEKDNEFCKRVCKETGAVVFDVDYRLAPEFKFPVPVDDCWAAFQWVRSEKAEEFNLDLDRVAIGGISAGGHLSAVVALKCRDLGIPLALQILAVPVTDLLGAFTPAGDVNPDCPYESYREMWDTTALPGERMSYFHKHFLGSPRPNEYDDASDSVHWHISPIRHSNFKGLAPALIFAAEMDPLRDEAIAYGKKMNEAGSLAEVVPVKGAPHIFMHLDDILEIGKDYNKKTVKELKKAFGMA